MTTTSAALGRGTRTAAWSIWARWTAWMTAGEFVGFGIPAVAGAVGVQLFPDSGGLGARIALATLLVIAGSLEGAVLGLAQAWALRRWLPNLSVRAWAAATAGAAALAWAIGMLPSSVGDPTVLPLPLLIAGAVVLGPVLLCSLGAAQWVVLRRHVAGAGHWVWMSAAAWLAGLTVVMAGMSLTQAGDPLWRLVVIAAASGLLMGATAAAVSGAGLAWLLRQTMPVAR